MSDEMEEALYEARVYSWIPQPSYQGNFVSETRSGHPNIDPEELPF